MDEMRIQGAHYGLVRMQPVLETRIIPVSGFSLAKSFFAAGNEAEILVVAVEQVESIFDLLLIGIPHSQEFDLCAALSRFLVSILQTNEWLR